MRTPLHGLGVEAAFTTTSEIEQRHDLLRYEFDGWCVWPLFRFAVARAITTGTPVAAPGRSSRFIEPLKSLGGDLRRLAFPGHAPLVVKTYTSGLAEQSGTRYRDIWFDDIIDIAGPSWKIDELSANFADRRFRAATPIDARFESVDILARFFGRFDRHPSRSAAIVVRELSEVLTNDFGLELFSPHFVWMTLRRFRWLKAVYSWLVRRVNPRWVMVADSGDSALVAAARENSIRVAEIQHGIMDRYHAGYSWTPYATPYREKMPIPDRLFLYGEHWRRELDAHGFWREALRVVGSLRVDRYRRRRRTRETEQDRTILLTTQGIDTDRIIRFVRELFEGSSRLRALRVIIRLHPLYDANANRYREQLADLAGVTILEANEPPATFELLAEADLHVSISSAMHYDALGLGVPTAILPYSTADVIQPLNDAGHAPIIHSAQDAIDLAMQPPTISADVSEYYFADKPAERLRRELTFANS
jgi:hypothetical protein